jgi:hypothetical protein
VLEREPRSRKTWFLAGSPLHNEEPVVATVREVFEDSGFTVTVDNLTNLTI